MFYQATRIFFSIFLVCSYFISSSVTAQDFGTLPNFEFENSAQEKITNENFKDKYLLLNFFFTSCPHVCPAINGKVSTLQRQFKDKVNFLSVSVDPENDTFKVLSEYKKKFGVEDNSWQFARSTKDYVDSFIDKLKLVSPADVNNHTTRMVLINPDGKILKFYRGLDNDDFKELQGFLKAR